jgi:DNA-binding LacI/PurR family transcriptional regulator
MEERTTIKALARASGVSVGTVSRALNGYADVRPATRERIRQIENHTLKKLESLPEAQRLRDAT